MVVVVLCVAVLCVAVLWRQQGRGEECEWRGVSVNENGEEWV